MKNKQKETTIYDIAKLLKISSTTVSRGLHNNPVINEKTRKKIQAAAQKLGYRHNSLASSLRNQKTNTIGLIVHELNSNFIISVLAGIEKITAKTGYDIIIAHSSESYEKEVSNAINLFHKRVDGVIASLSFNTKNLEHFKQFQTKGIPVIFFDRVEERNNNTNVIIDNYKCGYDATKHLILQGCKKIVLITATLSRNVYAQRHNGYKAALKQHKIKYNKKLVLIKDLSEQCGIDAANEIMAMKPMPDGIFITNDFTAAVCMKTLKEKGINIPKDIAIVGFNNDAIGKIIEPQLTTIDYPGKEMGEIAAQNLIDQLNGVIKLKTITSNTIVVNSNLIIRQSSLKNLPNRIS